MVSMVDVIRQYDYNLKDLAQAFYSVVSERFGKSCFLGLKMSWTGRRKPVTYFTVKSGTDQYSQGITGGVEIKGFGGSFFVGENEDVLPFLHARVSQKDQHRVDELFSAVHEYLKVKSIYKGKALTVDASGALDFLDLAGVFQDKIIYNEKVERDLQAHVWTILEQPELCRQNDVILPRKVLFSGQYGSGKTLAAFLTAQKAVARGKTFIYLEPSVKMATNAINSLLQFARRYKAVVLIEDIDREQREGDLYSLGRIMACIDGVLSKNADVLIVMTTNNQGKISPGLLRPGRIDKVINFDSYTDEDATRLLKRIIPQKLLESEIDWKYVSHACSGYTPAFICEVATSAKLFAISSVEQSVRVTQKMLLEAAGDLSERHKVCTQDPMGFHTGISKIK